MPISPSEFRRWNPFTRRGREMIRELADDVAELFSLLPLLRVKANEANAASIVVPHNEIAWFLIDDAETTSIDASPNRWSYKGKRCTINTTTGLATAITGTTHIVLYNGAEDDSAYQHGQDMAPNGVTLTTYPVEGPVPAFYSGVKDGDDIPIWIFDVLNPTQPACPE